MIAHDMDAIVGAMFVIFALDHRLRPQFAERRARNGLAPIKGDRGDAIVLQDLLIAQADDDLGPVALPQPLERGNVHMVIMIVADDDQVDLGQIIKPDARLCDPLRPQRRKGAGIVGPDRVGQDVEPGRLHQHRRMADPGRHHAPGRSEGWRSAGLHCNRRGPFGALILPGQPAKEKSPAVRARGAGELDLAVGVEEVPAIIMSADGSIIIDAVEKGRDDRDRKAQRDDDEQQRNARSAKDFPNDAAHAVSCIDHDAGS